MIPFAFHPNPKPGSNPLYNITVAIILYTAGMGVYGAKPLSVAFTNSTV